MQIPAYKIDDIKKAISEGTATPEDVEIYAQWKADLAAAEARDAAMHDVLVKESEARIESNKAQFALAMKELEELERQSEERLKAAQDGE